MCGEGGARRTRPVPAAGGEIAALPADVKRKRAPARTLARVIAITGCDGSGKSTLAADLAAHAGVDGRARFVYLGQSSGNIKRALAKLPLVGPSIARHLEARAGRIHDPASSRLTSTAAAVIYLLSRWRAHKFRRMLRFARRGLIVITDRYPQAEIPGFPVDGTGLGAKPVVGRLGRMLARREQRLYARMAAAVPALVIRLDVDVATAHARKPDTPLALLRRKVELIPTLRFNGARILAIDARRPYREVLDVALAGATAALGRTA